MYIEDKITELLGGVEDEIVQQMAVNLFLPEIPTDGHGMPSVDPKGAQLDLEGFLGAEDAAMFSFEMWEMMVDAQAQVKGIPKKLLEKKKAELQLAQEHQGNSSKQIIPSSHAVNLQQTAMSTHQRMEADRLRAEAMKRAEAARLTLQQQQKPMAVPAVVISNSKNNYHEESTKKKKQQQQRPVNDDAMQSS
eukprot:CAMPEP_0116030250 /NCGR_PEP_ID=MMETSP0321-20121206/16739_1 /TAXON_ID=163516 /ORGANISM="Leptocylindrus danicus var. danicus, Strain B650" /LENGTH=191 /DNA_ID=CAMNT_0003505013 /DNA_START=208 /DNA_END=783 /DNA_ORIENTATION=+